MTIINITQEKTDQFLHIVAGVGGVAMTMRGVRDIIWARNILTGVAELGIGVAGLMASGIINAQELLQQWTDHC